MNPALPLAAAVGAALLVAGCSDDGSDTADDANPPAAYEDALALLPASAGSFEFHSVAATEKRLNLDGEADAEKYINGASDAQWGVSSLVQYLAVDGSPLRATDIEWEAMTYDDSPLTIRAVSDDVDLEATIGELEKAGYASKAADDGTLLTADVNDFEPDEAALYLDLGTAILVQPDERLVVSARDEEGLTEYTDEHETLADAGTFDGLVDGDEIDAEHVYAQSGQQPCDAMAALGGHSHADPETAAQAMEPYEDLESPTAAAVTIGPRDGDPAALARLRFGDDETAESDADRRRELLEDGTSPVSNQPFADYFTVGDVTVDGSVQSIAIEPAESPAVVLQMILNRDAPFLVSCV